MFTYFLKIGWKNIKKTPILSGLVVLALGLGVGVFTSLFSLYAAISYVPMDEKSGQFFSVQLAAYGNGMESWGETDGLPDQLTHMDVVNLLRSDIPTHQTPFFKVMEVIETDDGSRSPSLDYSGGVIGNDFFSMFGLEFIYGNPWGKEAENNKQQLVVIDEDINLWAFNGENSVGKTLIINKKQFTIVGVTKTFEPRPYFLQSGSVFSKNIAKFFVPHSAAAKYQWNPNGNVSGWQSEPVDTYDDFLASENVWQNLWVELNTPSQQSAYKDYLSNYSLEQNALGRFDNPNPRGSIRTLGEWLRYIEVVSDDNRTMLALGGLFLLVCLFNCSSILLSKSDKNTQNTATRRALGATQYDTVKQLVIEASVLGVMAGVCGLAITQLGLWAIRRWFPMYQDIAYLPLSIMGIAAILALLVSILAALYPAIRTSRQPVSIFLKAQ